MLGEFQNCNYLETEAPFSVPPSYEETFERIEQKESRWMATR